MLPEKPYICIAQVNVVKCGFLSASHENYFNSRFKFIIKKISIELIYSIRQYIYYRLLFIIKKKNDTILNLLKKIFTQLLKNKNGLKDLNQKGIQMFKLSKNFNLKKKQFKKNN
jgi:hypothetical protein